MEPDVVVDSQFSKKEQVKQFILRELRSGNYGDGSLFPSENTLVRQLGICKNTVREAFSALVNAGLLERVRGRGTFVRCGAAASVVHEVRLLIGDFSGRREQDPFIGGILTGLHRTLDQYGWTVRTHEITHHERYATETAALLKDMTPGQCLLVAGLDCSLRLSELARAAGVHLVAIGRPEDSTVPFVHGDNRALTRAVVRDLVARGHKSIAFADHRATHAVSFDERRAGFLEEMSAQGLVPDARLLVEYQKHGTIAAAGREIWNRIRAVGVDFSAVIVYGDWAAQGLAEQIAAAGVKIPDDLSVYLLGAAPVFTADTIFNRGYFTGAESMGSMAGGLLLRLDAGQKTENIILSPRLFSGNSVRTLPAISA